MALADAELQQPANNRFDVTVIGGDAVFLVDRRNGHKLYVGCEKRLTPMERRRYIASLGNDIRILSVGDFFAKYGLTG